MENYWFIFEKSFLLPLIFRRNKLAIKVYTVNYRIITFSADEWNRKKSKIFSTILVIYIVHHTISMTILYIAFEKPVMSGIKIVGTKMALGEKQNIARGGLRNVNDEYTLECLRVVGLRPMSRGPLTSEYGDLRAAPTVANRALYHECRAQGDRPVDDNGVCQRTDTKRARVARLTGTTPGIRREP